MSAAAAPKRSRPAAEGSVVEKTRKAPARRRPAVVEPAPVIRRRPWFSVALVAVLAVAAGSTVVVSFFGADDTVASDPPAAVSQDELTTLAAAGGTPVYWAGRIAGRKLELTRTGDGTFVRYLPDGVTAGDDRRVLTVATYRVANAYSVATARAKADGMSSRRTRNGGIAVWSGARPTSVYVAFTGIPHLVEVYAPTAAEARRLALSGRIRPVR